MSVYDARVLMEKKKKELLKKKNVHMVGVGYKRVKGKQTADIAVICTVDNKVTYEELKKKDKIPRVLEHKGICIKTDVVLNKPIKILCDIPAQMEDKFDCLKKDFRTQENIARMRPTNCGISIGHVDITAGTLGLAFVYQGKKYILSNNHVLANVNQGLIGDPIVQPGTYDGGTVEQDKIGILHKYVEIVMGGVGIPSDCQIAEPSVKIVNFFLKLLKRKTRLSAYLEEETTNKVDCALCIPSEPTMVDPTIVDIGMPQGFSTATLGMEVEKSGRTTGYTFGKVEQVDVTVNVDMGDGRVATFEDQVVIVGKGISAGGDSGSAFLDKSSKKVVGLLFAGSEEATVFCRIENVFSALDIDMNDVTFV